MGRALIQSGGTDGRYSIQVDYGSAQRAALLAAFNQLINRYDADIIGQQADVDVVNGMLQDQIVRINQARDGVMPEGFPELAEPPANKPPGSPIDKQLQQLVITSILNGSNILRANLRRYTLNIEKMKMERADALKKVATLTTAQATVTKDAWCCTYTETAPAGAQVATIDVNGETDLTLVAPNARAWAPADGVMTMPHVMSPEQSFFNTAILPGWQKHRPRYRWGTITALDIDADTASVNLAPATSSAQRLDINLFSTLSNIPVEYMTCNAAAFAVGDRCIVEFIPGALSGDLDAKVIGFLDNPKPCQQFIARLTLSGAEGPEPGYQKRFKNQPWAPITAAAPDADPLVIFIGWSDAVLTLARNDGNATRNLTAYPRYLDYRASPPSSPPEYERPTRSIQAYGVSISNVNVAGSGGSATASWNYTVTKNPLASFFPDVAGGSVSQSVINAGSDAENEAILAANLAMDSEIAAKLPATVISVSVFFPSSANPHSVTVTWTRIGSLDYAVTAVAPKTP